MTDLTFGERLAVVEQKLADDIEDGLRRETKQDSILAKLEEIQTVQENVALDLAKYKGWFGGAIFIVSCIGTFLYKFGGPLFTWITRLKTGNG